MFINPNDTRPRYTCLVHNNVYVKMLIVRNFFFQIQVQNNETAISKFDIEMNISSTLFRLNTNHQSEQWIFPNAT